MLASTSALTFVMAAAPFLAGGQDTAARPANQGSPPPSSTIAVVGCLTTSADGKEFLLTRQAGPPGTTVPAPGTSATGEAPSGTVTGDTPTGTTATETAVPTPPVGEPGTEVNPASPTFNRGDNGTSGTVGRADTAGAAIVSVSYRLKATKGIDLAAHVGHTVEVRGTLEPDPRATGTSGSTTPASAISPVFTVQGVNHRSTGCTR